MYQSDSLGIDLGTTRTAVAHLLGGEPEIIENSGGNEVTQSVVQIEDGGNVVVGSEAKRAAAMNPNKTVREIKREMGSEHKLSVNGQNYTPEQLSAIILDKVVNDAEDQTEREIDDVVITIPAYFGENERAATINAGKIAGLNVKRLLPEPSAACLSYGLQQDKLKTEGEELVFVYDLGGGTFDASLVEVDYDLDFYETQNTDGIDQLGGEDFTDEIVEWAIELIEKESNTDISEDMEQRRRVREEAEKAKRALSSKETAKLTVPYVAKNYNFDEELTLEKFNDLTLHLVEKTEEPINELFTRADYSKDDVDTILLVGGASRMKSIEVFVEDYFQQEPSRAASPDKAIAEGAAIQSAILSEDDRSGQGTESPSGVISGTVSHVVSKSIGVELHDGTTAHLIDSDEQLPVNVRSETFGTVEYDQQIVELPIVEGESESAAENDEIGRLILGEQNPIPKREPTGGSLAVEFTYDRDGTLNVTAEDLLSNQTVDATFESIGSASDGQLAAMRKETPGLTKSGGD